MDQDRILYRGEAFTLTGNSLLQDAAHWAEIQPDGPVKTMKNGRYSEWRIFPEAGSAPHYRGNFEVLNQAYGLALHEAGALLNEEGTFRTGANWPTVWTRDISYATHLGLGLWNVHACMNSLKSRVRNGEVEQDTGTGGSWNFSSTAALRLSWFNGKGADKMDVDRLYTIWLNVNASYAVTGKTRLVFGVTPQISTDFDTWTSHNIFLGGHVLLAGPLNDRFSYGVGIGCYPQLGDYPLLPLIQFKWEASRNWTLQLEGTRLSYINRVSEGFKWGPFVSVVSGTWTIHHDRRVRQFAWISGVAGIGADAGLGRWGSVRPRLVADIGFSFGNSGTIKTSNGSHDLEKYHYDPGFYLRAGLLFEF